MPEQPARTYKTPGQGTKSGRWVFVEEGWPKGRRRFLCQCECGIERWLGPTDFVQGRTKSCGCYSREASRKRATKHGDAHSRLHWVWLGMRQRCINPGHISYPHYGGREIKVCVEWNDYGAFREWSLRNGYIEGATVRQTIERLDN